MADFLIRDIKAETLDALRARAREKNRSMSAEALSILEAGVERTAGHDLVAWAESLKTPDIDLHAVAQFVREMRDDR